MAEPNAQQLARQKLANTDLSKFAPPPPKRKKAEPEKPKYTKPAVKISAEERKAHKKAYAHAYYLAHKDEKKKRDAEYRKKNPELYRSNSLQWYYENKDRCNARNKEWRETQGAETGKPPQVDGEAPRLLHKGSETQTKGETG